MMRVNILQHTEVSCQTIWLNTHKKQIALINVVYKVFCGFISRQYTAVGKKCSFLLKTKHAPVPFNYMCPHAFMSLTFHCCRYRECWCSSLYPCKTWFKLSIYNVILRPVWVSTIMVHCHPLCWCQLKFTDLSDTMTHPYYNIHIVQPLSLSKTTVL